MRYIFYKTCLAFSCWCLITNNLHAISFEDQKKSHMIQDLEVIKHHFNVGYAPLEWKKEYAGWDLEEEFIKAKNQVLSTPSITTKQFQRIVRSFVNTMKDYHVDVMFFSTEASSLPFGVKEAEGRCFIDWLDPLRLPPSHYMISVGDELLEFDGQPIAKVIETLILENGKDSNASTDQTLAEMKLTHRYGMAGDIVPKGSVNIKVKSAKSGKENVYQLCWSYTPEYVKNPLDFLPFSDSILRLVEPSLQAKKSSLLPQIKMANPLHENYAKQQGGDDRGLGSYKSFLPVLGETLWIKEKEAHSNEEDTSAVGMINWYAYIYHHPQGPTIGCIRIPHYMGGDQEAQEFGDIINFMEENSDALVIDQLHNFGGLVDFQYELASMLVAQAPLITPYHRVKITQKEALEAYKILEFIKLIDLVLQNEPNDAANSDPSNGEKNQEDDGMMGLNYQRLMFVKDYYELLLQEWNQGHTLTHPTPILGVDSINPHPKYRYTKPILMLVNEMDFSGGDFMPAILQDNKRAVLFGKRTAGAGGFVFSFEFPNTHGIAFCSYTASIAERVNLQKIENLGVSPDVDYQITVEDLQNNYPGYVEAVNQAVIDLLSGSLRENNNTK